MKLVSATEFFEVIARRYDRAYALDRETTRARMTQVISALPAARARVLDLGVGTGRELGALQDAGYEVTGLDASPAMLEICARRARPVRLVRADLWAPLPFGDEAFDVVLALHGTLAHPPEREAYGPLGREVARVLRAGGPFVAEVPSRAWVRGLPPEGIAGAQGRIRRVADDRLVHEDESSGLAVEAIVPDEDEWRAALGASFDVRFGRLSDAEVLVVGARRALSRQSTEG